MPISYKYKFKFIHIPKTSGSSIEYVFDIVHKKNLHHSIDMDIIDGVKISPQHYPHSVIEKIIPKSSNWFSFSIVRNPYERIISEYFSFGVISDVNEFNENEFSGWLDNEIKKFDRDHKMPQSFFIDKDVDFILRFENLNKDFNLLNKKIGSDYNLIHKNSNNIDKMELVKNLSNETMNKIYNIYRKDFERFGYKKDI